VARSVTGVGKKSWWKEVLVEGTAVVAGTAF